MNLSIVYRGTILLAAISLFIANGQFPIAHAGQAPRPDDAAVAKAKKIIDQLYAERFAKAKKPAEKAALARDLLKAAIEAKGEPAAQLVLLEYARDLVVGAKNWPLALEVMAAHAERFSSQSKGIPNDPVAQIETGDRLNEFAKAEQPGRQRLEYQLGAAEWYLRAKLNSTGVTKQLAEKRLAELLASLGNNKNDDLKILLGTWDVQVGQSRGLWIFEKGGAFLSGKNVVGQWVVDDHKITIILFSNPKAWQTFNRPLSSTVTGDTWNKKGVIRGRKIESL